MTIHETYTPLSPAEVLERARSFFGLAGDSYVSFAEQSGDGYLKLQMDMGEVMIAALPKGEATLVRASASRGEHHLTRFLTTLASPLSATQTVHRYILAAGQAD